jgi:exodeoxyribonuclease VII large subunit
MSFKTPTAAAVFLENRVFEFDRAVADMTEGIHSKARDIISGNKSSLKQLIKDLASDARRSLEKEKMSLASIAGDIRPSVSRLLKDSLSNVAVFEDKARIYDPVNTLKLGYSITRDNKGAVIKNIGQLSLGDDMVTHLADGRIFSSATKKEGL